MLVEAARSPLPILFKQHPGDKNDLRATLRLRDQRNRLITNDERTGILDLFASGQCKLVVKGHALEVYLLPRNEGASE